MDNSPLNSDDFDKPWTGESKPPVYSSDFHARKARAWFLLGGVALLLNLHQIGDFDYWTHLALGRRMWRAGSIWISEPFLQSADESLLIPPSWPFELLLYGIRSQGGDVAVGLFVALVAGVVFALLGMLARDADSERTSIAWVFLVFLAFVSRLRFTPRPEVLSYLFLSSGLVLTHAWTVAPSLAKLAMVLVLLFIWVHVHAGWTIGVLLFLATLCLYPRVDFWQAEWNSHWKRPLLLVGVLVAAYMGYQSVRYLFDVLGKARGGALASVTEMRPLWEFPGPASLFIGAAIAALLVTVGTPVGRFRRLGLWFLAVGVALSAARNLTFALLALAPPALTGLTSTRRKLPIPRGLCLAAAGGATALFLLFALIDRQQPWGVGIRWKLFPRDAASFVVENALPEPVFNNFDIGGYLNWAWDGSPRTFIDGRVFEASPTFHDETAIVDDLPAYPVLARRGVRTIIMRALYYNNGRIMPVVYRLLFDANWTLVRASDALVFVRTPAPADVGKLSKHQGWLYVLREAEQLEREDLTRVHLGYTKGVAAHFAGQPKAAQAFFAEALKQAPEMSKYYSTFLRQQPLH